MPSSEMDAIDSIDASLRKHLRAVKAKKARLLELKAQKKVLAAQENELAETLQIQIHERQRKEKQLIDVEKQNENLYRSLAADHASFAALKEEDGLNHTKIEFLKQKNAELHNNKAAEQEQAVQLAKTLEQSKEKVTTLEQEKEKYKGIFKELEAKLRIDREAWEAESEHWKDKAFDMLQKLQAEENTLKAVKKKGAELAKNVVNLTKIADQHASQNKELSERLGAASTEAGETKETRDAMREAATALRNEHEHRVGESRRIEEEQEKATEQLKFMAEKVFQLLDQLQKMDEDRLKSMEEIKETKAVANGASSRCDQLTQALEELNALREREESHASQLNDVAATQKKQLIAVKKRLLALDKNTSVLKKKLVQREANLVQTQNKHEHLQERIQVEEEARKYEKELMDKLNGRVADIEETNKGLRAQSMALELAKSRSASLLTRKEQQLDGFRSKEGYYMRLEATLEAKREGDLRAKHLREKEVRKSVLQKDGLDYSDDESDDEGFPLPDMRQAGMDQEQFRKKMSAADSDFTRTSEEDRISKLKKMFRGKKGSEYDEVMAKLKISEEMLLDWTRNPSRLVKGLHILLTTMKGVKRAAHSQLKVASTKHDRVKVINQKSKELMARLQASEDHKTLAFMRIVKWIEHKNKQDEAQDSGQRPEQAQSTLELSENGLEDRDVTLLVQGLRWGGGIKEMDLRGNRIGNMGLLSLVNATLTENSAVNVLDMQQNIVTVSGLEAVAFLIHRYATAQTSKTAVGDEKQYPATVRGSYLKKDGDSLLPILEVDLSQDRHLSIDLRYNKLAGDTEEPVKDALGRITRVLGLAGVAAGGGNPTLSESDKDAIYGSEGFKVFEQWLEAAGDGIIGGEDLQFEAAQAGLDSALAGWGDGEDLSAFQANGSRPKSRSGPK